MTQLSVELLMQVVVTISATIASVAAVGIYRRVDELVSRVEKHDRTLYGVESINGWDGLVERVASHERELDEEREPSVDRNEHGDR